MTERLPRSFPESPAFNPPDKYRVNPDGVIMKTTGLHKSIEKVIHTQPNHRHFVVLSLWTLLNKEELALIDYISAHIFSQVIYWFHMS